MSTTSADNSFHVTSISETPIGNTGTGDTGTGDAATGDTWIDDTSPHDAARGDTAVGDVGFVVTGSHPETSRRITELLEIVEVVRPVIAADGGELHVVSVDVDAGIVTLRLSGACGSCAISSATLNQGIDRILRDRLDWVTSVVGQVEESEISGYGGWTPKNS
jgi:Fe-S cluster biogenesis protein NfuA